jgi:hypothetical protein
MARTQPTSSRQQVGDRRTYPCRALEGKQNGVNQSQQDVGRAGIRRVRFIEVWRK